MYFSSLLSIPSLLLYHVYITFLNFIILFKYYLVNSIPDTFVDYTPKKEVVQPNLSDIFLKTFCWLYIFFLGLNWVFNSYDVMSGRFILFSLPLIFFLYLVSRHFRRISGGLEFFAITFFILTCIHLFWMDFSSFIPFDYIYYGGILISVFSFIKFLVSSGDFANIWVVEKKMHPGSRVSPGAPPFISILLISCIGLVIPLLNSWLLFFSVLLFLFFTSSVAFVFGRKKVFRKGGDFLFKEWVYEKTK